MVSFFSFFFSATWSRKIKQEATEIKQEPDAGPRNDLVAVENNDNFLDEHLSTREQIFGRKSAFYVSRFVCSCNIIKLHHCIVAC